MLVPGSPQYADALGRVGEHGLEYAVLAVMRVAARPDEHRVTRFEQKRHEIRQAAYARVHAEDRAPLASQTVKDRTGDCAVLGDHADHTP
jgi:hypothetical protein